MSKQNPKPGPVRQEPGPGRSTSDIAFDQLRREIAQRNERTHQEARKLRVAREQRQQLTRRERDY